MATDRARKAADRVLGRCDLKERDDVAEQIDTAAGLPELEARIAELERELHEADGCREQSIIRGSEVIRLGREVVKLRAERDAALRKLEAVIHKLKDLDEFDSGKVHAFAADCLRLARGDK